MVLKISINNASVLLLSLRQLNSDRPRRRRMSERRILRDADRSDLGRGDLETTLIALHVGDFNTIEETRSDAKITALQALKETGGDFCARSGR